MEQKKEYYAFISYKREDEKWAKWLQKRLESYSFPTNLNGRTDLPKKIRPIFRDVTDLTPGLLSEEIYHALCNSEWLIVICSPRSAQSPWVCKEAQTFINLERADHIIPFIIEGVPHSENSTEECYPEALLNLTGHSELLAANINEVGRDAAMIKVIARMFGLKFDSLWQRFEREARKKRMINMTLTVIIFIIAFAVGAYIHSQKIILEDSKRQENISLCKRLASFSINAQKKGDVRLASLLLLESIDFLKKNNIPLLVETESALNHLVYGYGIGKFKLSYSFKSHGKKFSFFGETDKLVSYYDGFFILRDQYTGEEELFACNVGDMTLPRDNVDLCISSSGKYIILSDYENQYVHFFSCNDFTCLQSIAMLAHHWICDFNDKESQICIIDNYGLISTIDTFTFQTDTIGYIKNADTRDGKVKYINNDRFAVFSNTMIDFSSNTTYEIITDKPEYETRMCDYLSETSYTCNGNYIVKAYYGDYKPENRQLGNHCISIAIFDVGEGNLIKSIIINDAKWEDEYVRHMTFSDDNQYMAITYSNSVKIFECDYNWDYGPYFTEIQTIETELAFLKDVCFNKTNDMLLISSFDSNDVLIYSMKNRNVVEYSEGELQGKAENQYFRGWGNYAINNKNNTYYDFNEKNIDYDYSLGIISAENSYAYVNNDQSSIIVCNLEDSIIFQQRIKSCKSFDLSSDGKRLVFLDDDYLCYFDTETGAELDVFHCPEKEYSYRNLHFSGNDNWLVLQDLFDRVIIFSVTNKIHLYKIIDEAFNAVISHDGIYLGVHRRDQQEYFGIEELQTGRYMFSTTPHRYYSAAGATFTADFDDTSTRLLISSSSHEIYDLESGYKIDEIKNENLGEGYWSGEGLYSIGHKDVLYYPIESIQQKLRSLRSKIGNEHLTDQEKQIYGIPY